MTYDFCAPVFRANKMKMKYKVLPTNEVKFSLLQYLFLIIFFLDTLIYMLCYGAKIRIIEVTFFNGFQSSTFPIYPLLLSKPKQ